ncbi:related to CYB2-lactate dehydrogenase cytochrome b2 [Ramularia collo-cygni]|uniref:Related to CYB2-lactate dehydrogenase cytochrome b2 n=1 Tax=Ramularia collo-cygni TaxID=112498 RepID=A0A2D3ULP1_9PEZI|nr:related to CYB2-lactate dehydrogenase cytochrome b2 [Ramularia collo-cygni]CZT15262.1 related to CYB2-lactate dehydrogenase cytochrome b2 [Ramularia collo-cygni]
MYFSSVATVLLPALIASVDATRPFLNEPDTAAFEQYGTINQGDVDSLPDVNDIIGLQDFEYVARGYMNISSYTYYRAGAAGEWSYRNNLEAYSRMHFRPRTMIDINNIESTFNTTILGHNFSAPFFIAPAAIAGYGNETGEVGLTRGAAQGGILYCNAQFSTRSQADVQAARAEGQVLFHQLYTNIDIEGATQQIREAEENNFQAILLTIDSPADANRQRALRFGVGSADSSYTAFTWDYYQQLRNLTDLPVILKGIQTWEDAVIAANLGAPAIYLSNHGARQLDGSPSPFEVALEIHENAPWVFEKVEVLADGGVRYGSDVLKLLALGVKAVGMGRPFMFANVYGEAGVARAIEIMKKEIAMDAGNVGVANLQQINSSVLNFKNYNRAWGL